VKTAEYKVIELEIPPGVLAQAADPEVRAAINPIIEDALNEHGKQGWRLHASGLTSMPTIVLEREVTRRTKNPKQGAKR